MKQGSKESSRGAGDGKLEDCLPSENKLKRHESAFLEYHDSLVFIVSFPPCQIRAPDGLVA